MHYNEVQLENQITNAKNKPSLTLDTFDFEAAFCQFLDQIDVDYDRLYMGEHQYLNAEETKVESSFAIEYGPFRYSRTVHVLAEKHDEKWMFTFFQVSHGSGGSLILLVDKNEETNEDGKWSAVEKENGLFVCHSCDEPLGSNMSFGIGFNPGEKTIVTQISAEPEYVYGHRMLSLRVHLTCPTCHPENLFSVNQEIE